MAVEEHLEVLRQGVAAWNVWRVQNPDVQPDLRSAELSGAELSGAVLSQVDLSRAHLREANLSRAALPWADLAGADLAGADLAGAVLSRADLSRASLSRASLSQVDLTGAVLTGANFSRADLAGADLAGAGLTGAVLERAVLIETNLAGADLTGCRIYGISAWDLKLDGAKQENLVITPPGQPEITVDDLELAQFIYLLLHNEKIRRVIDTITSKVVLILGRFTSERKAVLDTLRDELRRRDYLPVLFDFPPSESRDITETISLLARMARFVVADVTNARSIPQELGAIVPDLPSVPVQPLLLAGAGEYGLFEHFRRYPWVLVDRA